LRLLGRACDVGVLASEHGTICHIEIGLISLYCKHVNQHQALIGAGTNAFGFRDEEPPDENEDFVLNFEKADKVSAHDLDRITAWMESMLASLCQLGNVKVSIPPCLRLVACAVYQYCLPVLSTCAVYLRWLPFTSNCAPTRCV